jgi:GTPase
MYNNPMFADKVDITVKAGKGGDGKLSFRHEKFRAKGGPDGGDGGRGGSIILAAHHNTNTLSKYRTRRSIEAEDGRPGGDNRKAGKSGQDIVLPVPLGTLVREGEQTIADLTADEQTVVVARGGRGGFGNAHFTASTRQSPRLAELGEAGEARQLTLELKLVADVGLVGLPNAGKSTLLSVISNARPEIADYPFTTVNPNLGVVDFDNETFLVADIPGLIEGASQGKGLGDEFLRHIERTAVLVHLIDAHAADPVADYKTIMHELRSYTVDLTAKPQIIALTKVEALNAAELAPRVAAFKRAAHVPVLPISAQAHQGLDELLRAVWQYVQTEREHRAAEAAALPEITIDDLKLPDAWQVTKEGGAWRVSGERIEGFARRTNWLNPEAVERLRDILRKTGVARELTSQGAVPGETVMIGEHELDWR